MEWKSLSEIFYCFVGWGTEKKLLVSPHRSGRICKHVQSEKLIRSKISSWVNLAMMFVCVCAWKEIAWCLFSRKNIMRYIFLRKWDILTFTIPDVIIFYWVIKDSYIFVLARTALATFLLLSYATKRKAKKKTTAKARKSFRKKDRSRFKSSLIKLKFILFDCLLSCERFTRVISYI